jgi:TonB-dependent starch-binding outer membrane protein SusC
MNFKKKVSMLWLLLAICSQALFATVAFAHPPGGSATRVTGKVIDQTGETLPGVTIVEKGTNNGTTTDLDGNYQITVADANAVLVFSFTGFEKQEVPVNGRTVIDVQLSEGNSALGEVVVVGYGTQRKADLTGAVSSVTSKDITGIPSTSIDQVLSGRSSGVHIANRSGDPAAPIEVRIRGVSTTGNNRPLWVIDGVAVELTSNATVNTASFSESNPLAGINPADIESIDVLKDASAAAIYGARAMNGVILVTTKRGKEGRTSAVYDSYYGVQRVPGNRRLELLDVSQYVALQKELGRDYGTFSAQPGYDWQDAVFQSATISNHNLSVSGGTQNFTFNIGGGYHDQGGVEKGQDFNRISLRANSDLKVGKFLKFGQSAIVSATNRLVQSEGGNFAAYGSSLNAPYFNPISESDPLGYQVSNGATRGDGATAVNFLWATDPLYNETRVKNRKMLGSVYGELEPVAGLKFRTMLGADYNVSDGYFFQEKTISDYGRGTRGSLLVQERPIELTTNWTNTLSYQKTMGKSDLMVMAGYEEVGFRYDKVRLQGRDLFNSKIRFAAVANTVAGANEADHWALRSTFARVNYAFNNKYLLQANLRRDQSSRFSPENRTGIFPSFSAGWRISEESFFDGLKSSGVIDNLKIRASWGQLGNQYTGNNFGYLTTLAINSFYALGNDVVRGPAPIIFANQDLHWETSTQTDFGFDAALFKGRVDLTFDFYNKTSNDVLISLPIPMSTGYFLPADANIGSINNRGIELGLFYNNRIGDFRYSVGGNITTVKNEVLDLGSIAEIVTGTGGGQTHRTTVGQPLGYFYGFKTDGIYQTQAEADAAPEDAFGKPSAGDIRFVDVNNDGKINSDDRTFIGSPIPGYYYGATATAGWKGFDLSLVLQGVGNVEIYNAARQNLENMNSGNNQLASVVNRWTPTNTGATIPRAINGDPNGNNRYSDRWIEDGSYLRLKNISVGYNLPAKKLSAMTNSFLSGARIYVGVQNLATFTKYKGYDPEVTRGASFQKGEFSLANGQDSGGSPQPTITQFGLQVRF